VWRLDDKHIGVAVTGGIAAYKVCGLIRDLRRLGAEVRVTMSRAAQEFVTPLTFETLSEHPVLVELFGQAEGTAHIEFARWCDLVLVAPATANILAKNARGFADDVVTTVLLASDCPIIFCPAMNSVMWQQPSVQENVSLLKQRGAVVVEPEWGELATSGEGSGWGRLAEPRVILHEVQRILLGNDRLAGKRLLVTAGRTEEPIDPVRVLTNRSSGKMGFAVAEAGRFMGADVVLISGPTALQPPPGVVYERVRTADEMAERVLAHFDECDCVVMAAAVADFRPRKVSAHKLKKRQGSPALELEGTVDILEQLGRRKRRQILVGFAVETENEIANATEKLTRKNLDLVVVNNPLEPGAAFEVDTNRVTVIDRKGEVQELPEMSKQEVAWRLLEHVAQLLETEAGQEARN
jgi:phosphopantothenoylcysteine decarboxylase/phosphopantothenate--cysteine ligase